MARSLATRSTLALLLLLVGAPTRADAAPDPTPPTKPAPRRTPRSGTASAAVSTASSRVASRSVAAAPAPALAPVTHAAVSATMPTSGSLSARESLPSSALDRSTPEQPSSGGPPLHHRFALTLNPLALVVGRYGANADGLLAPHHAIVASGYVQTFSQTMLHALLPSVELSQTPRSRFGGELGYRFYSGGDGPTGLFVGPSAVAMPLAYPRVTDDLRAEVVSFMAYGAALDVGVQAVIEPGFTMGGGVGVMALAYQAPASIAPPPGVTAPSYPEPHVLPRLLVMAGWSF